MNIVGNRGFSKVVIFGQLQNQRMDVDLLDQAFRHHASKSDPMILSLFPLYLWPEVNRPQ